MRVPGAWLLPSMCALVVITGCDTAVTDTSAVASTAPPPRATAPSRAPTLSPRLTAAIGSSFCTTDDEPCGARAVSLDSRAVGDLPGYPTAIDEDGGLVLLQFPPSTVETRGFSLYDIARRQTRPVFATDGSVNPILSDGLDFEGVRPELPPGWAPARLTRRSANDALVRDAVAVRLRDGGWLPIGLPGLTAIGGGHD